MKVLQVVPNLNAGGVERTTLEIVEALVQNGHEGHVVSAGGRMESELTELGGILHRLDIGSKNPLKLRRNTKALIDLVKRLNIDIIHARSRAPAWAAHAAAKATRRPFITTYHGIYNARSSLKKRYNAIMARGDIIIANSAFTKAHILSEHGTSENRITVIPRGVDMIQFDPARITAGQIDGFRSAWNIGPNDKAILLPGRLTRWKGPLVAIEALANLPAHYHLILMGDAQGRDTFISEIGSKAEELEVDDRLHVAPHTKDIAAALMAADVVISASTDPEAFGRVMAEAQAMQRPVIASAHGGALETVVPGLSGFLVPPAHPDALAAAIKKALNWPDYDGPAVRARIAENFSKTHLQTETLALYKQLVV